jgi:hypothetical protein
MPGDPAVGDDPAARPAVADDEAGAVAQSTVPSTVDPATPPPTDGGGPVDGRAPSGPPVRSGPSHAPTGPTGPAAPPYRPRRKGWTRWVPALCSAVAVATVIAVTLWQLHPSLLVSDTTTTGGDTGAHFMMPWVISTQLLPHFQLTGWSPTWYDGYPIYTFYFVFPDVLTAIASHLHLLPYNIAFKWSTVLGSVLLPVAAWACGRLFSLRVPVPAALAAATLPFLFDYSFTIVGGNLFSTLAGEYAYSLSIALAVLFLGLFARGLRTGRSRGWTAVVLAVCILSHVVGALFALCGAAILVAMELLPVRYRLGDDGLDHRTGAARAPGRAGVLSTGRAVWWGASTVGIGAALTAWWWIPFFVDQKYATVMGYTNVSTYLELLYPGGDRWVISLAAVATVTAAVLRSRFGILFSLLGILAGLGVVFDPQGSLYNVRIQPLWFLCAYLLVGWLFGVVIGAVARAWRRYRMHRWVRRIQGAARRGIPAGPRPEPATCAPGAIAGPLLAAFLAVLVVVPPFVISATALQHLHIHVGANEVSNWSTYNYIGYEGQTASSEYYGLMATMRQVGAQDGCGRAMWEYEPNQDRFGTPEALMLLAYWTRGCIDSQEGLLFESSATTPYHFLTQAELSLQPSEAVVGLDYSTLNIPAGIAHLQLLGVRYFMASSPEIQQAAAADPALRLVATSGPYDSSYSGQALDETWDIYKIADAQVVEPLPTQPAVLTTVAPGQSTWLPVAQAWFNDLSRLGTELTAGGPSGWQHLANPSAVPRPVPEPPTTVTHVVQSFQTISFHVSRTGTPVLVKVSYFPNWHAEGAEGPWRATPNLMVVVPTSHQVTLTYGPTAANDLGQLLTVVGVVALLVPVTVAVLRRRRTARSTPPAG